MEILKTIIWRIKMKKFLLTMGMASFFLSASVFADHKADLLLFSEELAENCHHLSEKLLVAQGYPRSVIAVEEMAESAEHFYEEVLIGEALHHVYQDYREFYATYKLARSALRSEYKGGIDIHLMHDWLDISHTFRSVRKIMRYYSGR